MDEFNELLSGDLSETQGKYLTFSVGDEEYGMEIDFVMEIIGMQPITEVPDIPSYIKGLINLRGKITPVMDVRLRFNKMPQEYDERTCIIVVMQHNNTIGLIVDTIRDVLDIDDDQIGDPAGVKTGTPNRYIRSIARTDHGNKLIINLERVLSDH
ncbi:MAG: chemotaxis protein CheW [Oscillospiraceae bacterium]|jgi:purine-binding chemotaxis protein CheW|nr:chemotaxis protein CheW [Oscillospiraceae bacterium]